MSEVHRYKAVQLISEGGGRIGYDPHGPNVVMEAAYDELRAQLAERDALLREIAGDVLFVAPSYRQKAEALLSACADPAPIEHDERAAFEAAYAREFSRIRGQDITAEDIASMRDSVGGYGDRAYLNGQWVGWQARAALERTDHHG